MSDEVRDILRRHDEHTAKDLSPAELVGQAAGQLPSDVSPQAAKQAARDVLDVSEDDTEGVTDYVIETGVFPAELLLEERWFVWAMDNDRKIPRAPWSDDHTEETYASWKNEAIWTDFDTADEWVDKLTGYGHASCIPAYEDNTIERLIFFDFDDCRDPETGAVHPHAWEFIQKYDLGAYLSTSGTGLHAFGWGRLPEGYKPSFERDLPNWNGENPHLEVYASARFMALTGEHIDGTPISVPDLGETAVELFETYGNERVTGTEREPEVSREELADVDTTDDVSDIYDAIAHTRPRDISLRSPVSEEYAGRDANCARDPSWANSDSGTRLAEFDDHWLYRKGNHRLDALQVVALEERIIRSEDEYPSGEDFVDAVDALRDRGAHIPELETRSASPIPPSSKDAPEDAAVKAETQTDGGAAAQSPATESDTTQDADSDDGDGGGSAFNDWETIRSMFRNAENADERATPRFESAMKLHREQHFANLQENEVLYCYDDATGIYDDNGRQLVRSELTNGLEEQYRGHTMSEVMDHIRGRNTVSQDDMGGPDGLIAARNCVIDLHEETRCDHSPEYMFQSRLGTEFDPDATAPQWRAFLDDVAPSGVQRQKLQEFAGYCLHHWSLPYHKALFLVGPTASGKSTFLDTINEMLGEGTVASLTPQQLTSERFGPAELFGKWANIRNDIPKSTVKNTGMFKELIAGDPMKAEKKNKDPFFFQPTAKHLFSANQLPEMEVDDEAFFRRILLVPFPETVPKGDRDKHLDDKLRDELPGILNWAIEGLQRLLGQGGFTGDHSPGRTRETWSKWGDSVQRFAKHAISNGDDDIGKGKLYAAYLEYCRQESIPSDTQHSMTRQLKQEGFEDGRVYIEGEQKRAFLDIELTGRGEQLLDDAQSDEDTSPAGDDGRGNTGLNSFD